MDQQGREEKVLGGFPLREILPRSSSEYVTVSGLQRRGTFDFVNARIHSATLEALAAFKEYIIRRAAQIEEEMRAKNGGWFPVKVSKKVSSAGGSVQCSIVCLFQDEEERRKMDGGESLKHNCTFWAAKSQLHQEGDEHYCPAWLVQKGLAVTAARSATRLKSPRVPVSPQVWPRGLKEQWIEAHLSQLPREEEIVRVAEEKERQTTEAQSAAKRQAEVARLEIERREEEARADAARRDAAKAKRRAGLECKKNVDVVWKEWRKKPGGGFVAQEYEAEGVDLYFAGERIYIVFPDGEEVIKKKSNVQITDQKNEVGPANGAGATISPR